jgi:hypothetical protein
VENFTRAISYLVLGRIMLELAAPLRTAVSCVIAQKSRKPVTGLIRSSYSFPWTITDSSSSVGVLVGKGVLGAIDGGSECRSEGLADGFFVGDNVGLSVGLSVGANVGRNEGASLRVCVGEELGLTDGMSLGETESIGVGEFVGGSTST